MKKSLLFGATLILTLSLSACEEDYNKTDNTIHVESVSVASIHELEVGETFTVGTNTVTVLPDNATDKSYSLASDDLDVFTTDGYVITAVGEGSATLTVTTTDGGFTDWTTITVKGDTETEPGPETGGGTGGDDNPNTGGEPEPELTTLGLTINKAAYNLEVGESEALDFTVTPEGAEYTLVTSSTESSVADITYDTGVYTIHALSAGSTTISITATGDSATYNDSTTESITVTVTEPDVYTYVFSIDNKADVPTDWEYSDVDSGKSFTVVPKLTEYKNGVASGETETLSASEVSLEASNEEDTASDIVTIDESSLTISPKGVGVVTITATYTGDKDGVTTKEDSFTLTVSESYKTEYALNLTKGDNTEIQVGSGSFDIEVYEVVTVTALSTGEVDSDESSSTVANELDLSFSYTEGYFSITGFTITPTAAIEEATDTTITITWISHPEATCVVNVHLIPKEGATYALEITDVSALQQAWYTNDEAREITVSVTKTEDGETTTVEPSEYQESLVVDTYPEQQSVIEINGLTITPIGVGRVYLTVHWTEHEEARASVLIEIGEHTYGLEITNAEELEAEPWSIEDGEKTLVIVLTSDREDIDKDASSSNVELTYDSDYIGQGSSYFALKPVAVTNETTITASWTITDDGGKVVSDSITISTDDTIKVTAISLNETEVTLDAPGTIDLVATLTGKNGETATSTAVTWTVEGDSSITVSDEGGLSATVTAAEYKAQAVVKAVPTDYPDITAAECAIGVSEEPSLPSVEKEVGISEVVTTPDDNGVYVLGIKATEDTYVEIDGSTFKTGTSYNNSTAIRVVPTTTSGTYTLKAGDQYITQSGETVGLGSAGAEITIDSDGKVSCGSYFLALSDGSVKWSQATADEALCLLDMQLGTTYVYITDSSEYEGTLYFAANVNGDYYYFTGSASSGHGTVSTDVSNAAETTIEHVEDNKFYMKTGSAYLYLKADSTRGVDTSSSASTNQQIRYNKDNDCWQGASGVSDRFFALYSNSDMRPYAISNINQYEQFKLVDADPDLPEVKGLTLTADELQVQVDHALSIHTTVYPSCVHTADIEWTSSNDSYATVKDGMVTGVAEADEVTITAKSGNASDSIVISVLPGDENEDPYIGAFDFTTNTTSSTTALTSGSSGTAITYLNGCWTGNASESSPITDVVTAANVFNGAGGSSNNNSGLQLSNQCMKIGGSSAKGELALSLSTLVRQVDIIVCGWSGSITLNVNSSGKTISQSGADLNEISEVSTYTWTFADGITSLDIVPNANGNRPLFFSIALYSQIIES